MTGTPRQLPCPHPGRGAVALLALLTFGCTVVRAPASAVAPRIPVREGVAEPQLELWLESGGPVAPPEASAAGAEGRAALEQALASRRLEEGEQLLVVRAQGVSRTSSRRSNQTAAVAGMVVGVVVVVVAAIAAGKGSGGHRGVRSAGGARPAPRPAAGPVAAAPRPPRVGPRAVPIAPHGHAHGVGVGVAVGVVVPIVPPPPPPPADTTTVWHGSPPPDAAPGAAATGAPAGPPPSAPPEPARPEELAELYLPPLAPLDLESRGFFAGDSVRVELLLVDRKSGAPLWVKSVEEDVDPRDAEKMKELLDRALDEPGGWSPAPL